MTQESRNASPSRGCPDPRLIAAHADRRLAGAEAARMDEHIAGCPDCYDVFSETVTFGLAEGEQEGVSPTGARVAAPSPFVRRPAFKAAAVLATAAVLLVALGLWFSRARTSRAPVPLVAELAQAMGDRRFVAPRLTGGFRHGRLITLRSGDTPQGLDAQSPAVLAAVARIRERAEADTSPEALGALGVTYLVSGDAAAAVKALESASAQQPDDARLLSDLAAAYLVRAEQADEPADIPKALESAERAVALADAPTEAWFNRALALERLHLVDAARKAWEDYLGRDPSSGWADEAKQHLEALPKERRSSAEADKARVRAALDEGSAETDLLADEAPHLLREYFDDELLPAWAEAHLVGHPDANLHRERARVVGDALLRTTTDAMSKDAARALGEPLATDASRDPLRAQALGYRALREAKRLYDLQEPSCAPFRAAQRELQAGGSPYVAWARLQAVIACLYPSEPLAALDELDRLEGVAEPRSYVQLLGRVKRVQGLIHGLRSELTLSLHEYRSARDSFRRTGDAESEAVSLGLVAENLQLLGETRGAWRERQLVLALLPHLRDPRRRHGVLGDAGLACLDERLPRSALHFGTALVESAFGWSRAAVISDALVHRSYIHHWLGADEQAVTDLVESRRWIARTADESLAEKQRAECNVVEGAILLRQQPEQAADFIGQALTYFRVTAPARVPGLHLQLARAHLARGSDDGAEGELVAGIQLLERQRTSLRDAGLQVSFFDQAWALFDDMIRFQVITRDDPERALAFVERGRARQLVDSLADASIPPLEPETLQRQLPAELALVYHVSLSDRLFTWVLTRDAVHFVERSLPAAELSRLVAAYRGTMERPTSIEVVRRTSAHLHEELIRPLLPSLASRKALVFIPDGVLQGVAFASLWNPQTGRYLVEDYLLGLAPSGTVFIKTSAAAAASPLRTPRALIVGNPRFDRRLWTGLPNLPGAHAEAAEIASLYHRAELLSGVEATKRAFLDGFRRSQVVHYAGHAAARGQDPSSARLLLAPDPLKGDSGALSLYELGGERLPRTRLVVLAACRTAAGADSRVEGALSLGRPFLAVGVPDVVASLWDIDDAVSRRFFVALHRALLETGEPLVALRNAQIAFLRDADVSVAHPASWASFVCMGGLDPHSFSKGELS